MQEQGHDQLVLKRIERLLSEEHQRHTKRTPSGSNREQIQKLYIDLDRCWNLLRQRRALRETGHNSNDAVVRSPSVIENDEQYRNVMSSGQLSHKDKERVDSTQWNNCDGQPLEQMMGTAKAALAHARDSLQPET